jgi:septal ring factor EnvC (AmiA/AmiB activator)
MFKKNSLSIIQWTLLLGLVFPNPSLFAQENRIQRLEQEIMQLKQMLSQQSIELMQLQRDLQVLQMEKTQMQFAIDSLKQQVQFLLSKQHSNHSQPKIPLTSSVALSLIIPLFQVPVSYFMLWLS